MSFGHTNPVRSVTSDGDRTVITLEDGRVADVETAALPTPPTVGQTVTVTVDDQHRAAFEANERTVVVHVAIVSSAAASPPVVGGGAPVRGRDGGTATEQKQG